jgi:hypothetical protein
MLCVFITKIIWLLNFYLLHPKSGCSLSKAISKLAATSRVEGCLSTAETEGSHQSFASANDKWETLTFFWEAENWCYHLLFSFRCWKSREKASGSNNLL